MLGNKKQPAPGPGYACLNVPVGPSRTQGIVPAEAWAGYSYLAVPESPDSKVSVTLQDRSYGTLCSHLQVDPGKQSPACPRGWVP